MEDVDLGALLQDVGTPTYVYSLDHIERRFAALSGALRRHDVLFCYAVKANSALSIMRCLARLGAGADIVSGGELERALEAGIAPDKIVFSGVGKTDGELDRALEVGIASINIESAEELDRVGARARAFGKEARVTLRVNPDVDPATHPYLATGLRVSKFGIAWKDALDVARTASRLEGVRLVGLGCHIGSQIADVSPYIDSLARLRELIEVLRGEGVTLEHLDLGGGFGVAYREGDRELDVAAWGRAVDAAMQGLDLKVIFEPGRYLVANAGVLLTRVLGRKHGVERTFVIVDAAMNDLLRPSLYRAYHGVVPVVQPEPTTPTEIVDVVGPVCESGDFLAQERPLTRVETGEYLAVLSAGAYGMTMASTYNSRPLPAEVLVHGSHYDVIRPRKEVTTLWADEVVPAFLR